MVTDAFGLLLQELSAALKVADLKPDLHNTCLIKFPKVSIQLELDRTEQNLIMGCSLNQIPPGKYRENVFKEALRANGQMYPHAGDFAYSKQADQLVLIKTVPLKDLTGEKLLGLLAPLIQKAIEWNEAITRGEIPSITSDLANPKATSGMFGLR